MAIGHVPKALTAAPAPSFGTSAASHPAHTSHARMNAPRLIVGLGNPTDQHAHDRHNAGFWFIDALLRHYPGQMRPNTKFLGDVGEVRIGTQVVRLLKPMTYMNRSNIEDRKSVV